jgi:hypothetical protein
MLETGEAMGQSIDEIKDELQSPARPQGASISLVVMLGVDLATGGYINDARASRILQQTVTATEPAQPGQYQGPVRPLPHRPVAALLIRERQQQGE